MFRFFVAVVLGYLVMALLIMAAFSLALVAPTFVFQPDSFDVSPAWIAYTLTASTFAAAVGGYTARAVARNRRAAAVLAGVVLVAGLASAVHNAMKERPEVSDSPAGLSVMDRATRAVQPTWFAFTLPFLGMVGVLLGGRSRA